MQIHPHGLLDINAVVSLCFVYLNSVVLLDDFKGSDDPAIHDLLATEFPARASIEQFP